MPDIPSAARPVLEAASRKGVAVEVVTFPESTHTAAQAAAAIGAEVAQIVKSLVFVTTSPGGDLTPVLALVSGVDRVDLGRLAAVLGASNVRRASADEARSLTGYVIGGIPPFGHPSPVRTVMDPDLGRFPVVWAAAGTPNAVFAVPPGTLRMLSNAVVAPIAVASSGPVPVGPGPGREAAPGEGGEGLPGSRPAGAISGA